MRQCASVFAASVPANGGVLPIVSFNIPGAKYALIHCNAAGNGLAGLRIVARDSSRSYTFAMGNGPGLLFPVWIDNKGRRRSHIELQGNATFEVVNDTSGAMTNVSASVMYDVSWDDQPDCSPTE
jgi:hypothetical protein